MKIAYLILAHANASHLHTMISALASENAVFVIHIDKKSDIREFASLRVLPGVVFCENRVNGGWGDFSLVNATLELMRTALNQDMPASRLALLSGACFPVQPAAYIEAFFRRHSDREFIEHFDFPNDRFGKPLGRLSHYWLRRSKPMIRGQWRLQQAINAYAPERNYRKALGSMQPMTGSQWWAITAQAANHVLDFVGKDRRFYKFCQNIDCPDELFFQTLLWNSPFRDKLSHSVTYTDWSAGGSGPAMIGTAHLAALEKERVMDAENNNSPLPKAEVLFARKFGEASAEIVDALLRANAQKLQGFQQQGAQQ